MATRKGDFKNINIVFTKICVDIELKCMHIRTGIYLKKLKGGNLKKGHDISQNQATNAASYSYI